MPVNWRACLILVKTFGVYDLGGLLTPDNIPNEGNAGNDKTESFIYCNIAL